jgi:hypothetical protein
VTGATTHGPYSGTPTTTGAAKAPATLGTAIAPLPPNPTATYYNKNGLPQNPMPIPYMPAGGLGTNGTEPRYQVNSDFDYESIQLGLYQEWIELDLFNNGLAVFSDQDFLDAGLTAEDRAYIAFMAIQETGHATLLTNMLGETATRSLPAGVSLVFGDSSTTSTLARLLSFCLSPLPLRLASSCLSARCLVSHPCPYGSRLVFPSLGRGLTLLPTSALAHRTPPVSHGKTSRP